MSDKIQMTEEQADRMLNVIFDDYFDPTENKICAKLKLRQAGYILPDPVEEVEEMIKNNNMKIIQSGTGYTNIHFQELQIIANGFQLLKSKLVGGGNDE